MEDKNIKQSIIFVLFVCLISYICLFKLDVVADAEILSADTNSSEIKSETIINTYELLSPTKILKNQLLVFVSVKTGLNYSESKFIVDKCKQKDIDLFLLLGLLKKESGFDPNSTGSSGEIGLAQLMEKTAKHYSNKLGYEYDRKMIYDPKTNVDIAVEHLSYLSKLYDGYVHKVLTAYNRGTKGLENYINGKESPYEDPCMSSYSVEVLNFMDQLKEEFEQYVQ